MNYITCPRCQHITGLAQVTTENIFCSKCGQKMRVRSPQASQQQQTLPRKTTARPKPTYTGAIPERDTIARPKSYDFEEDFGGQTQEVSLDDFEIDYSVVAKSPLLKIMCAQVIVIGAVFFYAMIEQRILLDKAGFSFQEVSKIQAEESTKTFLGLLLLFTLPTLSAIASCKRKQINPWLIWFASVGTIFVGLYARSTPLAFGSQAFILAIACFYEREFIPHRR